MLHFKKSDEIGQLKKIAEHLNGTFIQKKNFSKVKLDNEFGVGSITSYLLFNGLSVTTFNVTWGKEFRFAKEEKSTSSLNFIYCLKGFYFIEFSDEIGLQKVGNMQNVIYQITESQSVEVIMPAKVKMQVSQVSVIPEKIEQMKSKESHRLKKLLKDSTQRWKNKLSPKYFGEINLNVSNHVSNLIENTRKDDIGRLINEGAVLMILASQLQGHENNAGRNLTDHGLTEENLKTITQIGAYINDNIEKKLTIKNLSNYLGVYPKKLQSGCQFLYGETVGQLIQRLRIEKARHLLQHSDFNISEVCYAVGISSRSYFSKLFYEMYGMMPSDFKRYIHQENMVFELSYKSKARSNLKSEDFENILKSAKINNKRYHITGALVYSKGVFFQIIEGPKKHILELYEILKQDKRHYDVSLIRKGVKTTRTFNDWTMAFLSENAKGTLRPNGRTTFMDLGKLVEEQDENDIFSDILWRRALNILNTSVA